MRGQECREVIDKAAEMCDLDKETVRQVKGAARFVESKPEYSGLATDAIHTLIRIQDKDVREKVILSVLKDSD